MDGVILRCVVVSMLDCDILVIEFERHSGFYVHFQTNTLKNGISLVTGFIRSLLFFQKEAFGIK